MGSGQVFDFGLRLRKLRENKHLSQEELGNTQYIYDYKFV